jgi:nucleoside-diphosphate-sugar epimerase
MRILVLGANGFIGSHLVGRLLATTDWDVTTFDLGGNNLETFASDRRFSFRKGDIFESDDWIDARVRDHDVVLPLVGVAKPAFYVTHPVRTFELDFEQNLKIVRMCVTHRKRVVFPSTSEVYGMSPDAELSEDSSPLTVGPISQMRWIYSASKQLMDRVIAAYGQEEGLRFTLFRPFNWIGPRLDTFEDAETGSARSITQFVHDALTHRRITLVNGGSQRRSFTYIDDGIEGLVSILRNEDGRAEGEIFNIGNPANNASIRELAELILDIMGEFPAFRDAARETRLVDQPAAQFYGPGYADMQNRIPSIGKMTNLLGWRPKVPLREAVRLTLSAMVPND